MADEVEIFEEAPDRREAEREAARPERLADHQHAHIFVLLLDQIAAHRAKMPMIGKRGQDGDDVGERARQQADA